MRKKTHRPPTIDIQAAIWAAVICVAIVGLVVLIAWSAGPGPDWIWQVIIGGSVIAVTFYAIYTLIATR